MMSTNDKINHNMLLSRLTYQLPTISCYFKQCSECQNNVNPKRILTELLDSKLIHEITYKSWVSTDRTSLETITKSTEEFLEMFMESLDKLLRHDFTAKLQSAFLKSINQGNMNDCILVLANFEEK